MNPKEIKPKHLNLISEDTLISHLNIKFTNVGEDFVEAKMPINETTFQPMGLLHGGASVTLAETVGSSGSHFMIDSKSHYAVCIEISANHVGSAYKGFAHALGKITHKGKSTHVWNVEIKGDNGKMISICKLTMMILKR